MSAYNDTLSNIKVAVPELSDPTNLNASQADPLIKIASAIAPTIDATIAEINNTIKIITDIAGNLGYGKPGYYIKKALEYQYDANGQIQLMTDPESFDVYYSTIDTAKQIIKQAAYVREITQDGNFYINSIKVAKKDQDGILAALSLAELADFKTYFANFDPPGTKIKVYSNDANKLTFSANVTYILGYSLESIKVGISTQLETFRDTFAFNGIFFTNDLCTFIKNNVPGVRNMSLSGCRIDNINIDVAGESLLSSGYFNYENIDVKNFIYDSI